MQVFGKIKLFSVCMLLMLLIVLCASANENIKLPEPIHSIKIYAAGENQDIREIATLPDQDFKDFDSTALKSDKVYWLKIIIDNKLANDKNYILHFKSSISHISLFQQDEAGKWTEQKAGILISENDRALKGFIKDKVPFVISGQPQTTIYIRIMDAWGKAPDISDITVLPAEKFNRWLERNYRCQFFFLGVIAVLCLFNFILYFFTKEKIYFYYAVYALLAGIYFSTYFQIIETGFFSAHPRIFNYLFLSITLNQAMYCWFLFEALKNNKVERERIIVRKYGVSISIAALVIITISIFNFSLSISFNEVFSLANGIFIIFILIKLFKKVSATVRIILAGSLFVVIGGVAAVALNLFKIAVSHVYIYQSGFFIELIFFSVAINFMHYGERMEKLKVRLRNSLLESERLKKEKEACMLRDELNLKNRTLTTKAIIISQKESFIGHVSKRLKELAKNRQVDAKDIHHIISDLNLHKGKKYWEEFETHFTSVHPNFYKSLNEKYPNLTANERKLCAFLKLNLSTKEIAFLSGKSIDSVDVARSRLRKKMGLNISDNLTVTIASID